MGYYLPRLEWEYLQEQHKIHLISEPDFLKDSVEHIVVQRDENFRLCAQVVGKQDEPIPEPKHDRTPGARVTPFAICGTDRYGRPKYKIEHCYLRSISNKRILNSSNEYINHSSAKILFYKLYVDFDRSEERRWLTEWYLNAPDVTEYSSRSTKRKYSCDYTRRRYEDKDDAGKFVGDREESSNVDYICIRFGDRRFILHSVPKQFGPEWSNNIGIEYREQFGGIPEKHERDAISEIVGFVFGRHLLNIGFTEYNQMGYPLSAFAVCPWGDARSQSQTSQFQPLRLSPYGKDRSVETVLSELLPKYLERKESLGLSEALWRYWLSSQLPIGTSIPLLATGLEIMAAAWIKTNKSASKGVYMDKNTWDDLLKNEFKNIEKALRDHEYSDRMLSRIRNSFQMGFNERFDVFLQELGLAISDTEKDAMKARNKMTHASFGNSPKEIEDILNHTHAYRTLFHRVFLKVLDHGGSYIDYSALGWPDSPIDQPAMGRQ